MMFKKDRIVAALFASCLAIVTHAVDAAPLGVRGRDFAGRRMHDENSELRRDDKELLTDVNLLRSSLRHHASQERIEMLRCLVREDWSQIVTDRGHPRVSSQGRSLNIAAGRFNQNARIRPHS